MVWQRILSQRFDGSGHCGNVKTRDYEANAGKSYFSSELCEMVFKSNDKFQVRPERQKLLNLKYKNKFPTDDLRLSMFEIKPNFKLMMVGSLETDIEEASKRPDEMTEVLNDLDQDEDDVPMENREVYLTKINKRIREYQVEELNPGRDGKKLLVLDIDYTLFDHRSTAETGSRILSFLFD